MSNNIGINDQTKLVVGQVRIDTIGEYEILAIRDRYAWVVRQGMYYTWTIEDCMKNPVKRKAPALSLEVPPKLVVGQVRLDCCGAYTILALHNDNYVWARREGGNYFTFRAIDCEDDPVKRKVPVLSWEVPPWARSLGAGANGWYLLKTDGFSFGLPFEHCPPLEAVGTTYSRDELERARREAGL